MKEFESRIARGRSMSLPHKTTSISVILLSLWAGAQDTRQAATQAPEIGHRAAADADHKKTLLLKESRQAELGRQPRRAREIFLRHQGPDHVRHRQRHGRRNVPKPLPLAGNSVRIF